MYGKAVDPEQWREVLEAYDLPKDVLLEPAGGTATPKVLIETVSARYILRRRPADMVNPSWIAYEHALRNFLADRGFPAPPVVPARTGRTWVTLAGSTFEMSCVLPGTMVAAPDQAQLHQAGQTLAEYHQLGRQFYHPGKGDFVREDHIWILQPLLDQLFELTEDQRQRNELARLQETLDQVAQQLDSGLYASLEHSVIHGDFHPGNVLFQGERVSGVVDYDYASRGAVLRDIGDGLLFFAFRRAGVFDPHDIWSLAQVWIPDRQRAVRFLRGYCSIRPLPADWAHLHLLMLSRWLQQRLRGIRKVPAERKTQFCLTGLWQPVQWLTHDAPAWLADLKARI